MQLCWPLWHMAPCSCFCLYCWQDVYRSTNPGNSLCMFTEIYSDVLTMWRQFQRRYTLSQLNVRLSRLLQRLYSPDRQSSSQRWHSTKSRYSVRKSEIYWFQVGSSGKCAIIPHASFNMTMTVLCALPVRCPSNAVTRFKSNQCTNVTSHRKCTVLLESKMARAKVM